MMPSLPQVELSFGAHNGAWDDRALIAACDTAMAEFHAHHPGPGSWLDKATAAQLAGKPLKDGMDVMSSWYTASSSTTNEAGPFRATAPVIEVERPNKRPRRQKMMHHQADSEPDRTTSNNPYAAAVGYPARSDGGASPHYAPASPIAPDASLVLPEHRIPLDLDSSATVDQPAVHPPAPPSVGVSPVEDISEQQAMAYAMSSQYWAGYWMGVAQSMRHNRNDAPVQVSRSPSVGPGPAAEPRVSVTRREFGHKSSKDGLRR